MSEPLPPVLPAATVDTPRRFRIPLVWIIPLVAALIGLFLAAKSYYEQGPTITIQFGTGEGLEPGKTRIKYKDVDVGQIVAVALSGADPTIMLTGPMPATRKALAKAGLRIDQIDLFEVNEAFAAVPMKFMKEMGVPHEKVNVNGGAIAMGHPLGATGAMILNTLIDELHRRQLRYGLATLCVGGGMGIATIVERI